MNNKLFASILLCSCVMFGPISALAKELKVGLGELDYPPFYFEQDEQLQGAVIEITQHLATQLGHTFIFKRYPWRRVQAYLRSGEIDMSILYFKTPERAKDVVYTDTPHIFESSYLFVAKDTKISYDGTLNGLQSYKFGNVRGYSHGAEYDKANYLDKQEIVNEKLLIRMLIHGRLDIAVGNKAVINSYAKQEGLHNKISFLTPAINQGPNFIAFSKANKDADELAQAFSTQVKQFITTETYRLILQKHGFALPE